MALRVPFGQHPADAMYASTFQKYGAKTGGVCLNCKAEGPMDWCSRLCMACYDDKHVMINRGAYERSQDALDERDEWDRHTETCGYCAKWWDKNPRPNRLSLRAQCDARQRVAAREAKHDGA
jgi:hypothetical protein